MGPNSFIFTCIFTEKHLRQRSTPPLTGARPPTRNPGSATAHCAHAQYGTFRATLKPSIDEFTQFLWFTLQCALIIQEYSVRLDLWILSDELTRYYSFIFHNVFKSNETKFISFQSPFISMINIDFEFHYCHGLEKGDKDAMSN